MEDVFCGIQQEASTPRIWAAYHISVYFFFEILI